MTLETGFERIELPLERPFVIARGTSEIAENVLVTIEDEQGRRGLGAGAPIARYGETIDSVEALLPALLDVVEDVGDPHDLQRIERRIRGSVRGNPAARCAISIALFDLLGKRLDLPLYRFFGFDPERAGVTSYTIGIGDPETVRERAEEAIDRGFSILKVKLDADHTVEILEAVRKGAPDATIRVDANEAWTSGEAIRNVERIAPYDVEFVEQPVPAEDHDGLRYVHERSPIPIAVDESCVDSTDVPRIADRASIVVLKLEKCGGIAETIRAIHAARAHGLSVMLGCMIETNASIAAACHLSPLVDYADLDGSLLLADDPYTGVPIRNGTIELGSVDRSGTGARRA